MDTSKVIPIVVVVLIATSLLVAFQLGFLSLISVNVATQAYKNAGWRGSGQFQGGGANLPGSELLSDDEYIASWSPSLEGQVATAGLHLGKEDIIACSPDNARYDWYRNIGSGWGSPVLSTEVGPGGIVFLLQTSADVKATTYTIKGISEGAVRVTAWIHCAVGDWFPLAQDEARVISGIGSVNRVKDQVTVGEDVSFRWDIPYVTDDATGRGWSIIIYSSAQNRVVQGPTALAQLQGTVTYKTTTQDFSVASGCRNEIRATLRNELWNKAWDVTTVIDVSGAGPSVKITGFLPLTPKQGDTVKVTWTATENPTTKLPLTKIVVQTGFGGVETDQELAPGAREFSFVAGQAGTTRVAVIAYDSGCRPSPTQSVDITVSEPGVTGAFPLLSIVLAIVAGLGGLIIYRFTKGVDLVLRILLSIIPIVVVAILFALGVLR